MMNRLVELHCDWMVNEENRRRQTVPFVRQQLPKSTALYHHNSKRAQQTSAGQTQELEEKEGREYDEPSKIRREIRSTERVRELSKVPSDRS